MRCPSCGASVSDGALLCPRCHAEIGVTQKIDLGEATWCPGCGALVAAGADACPKCGTSLAPEGPVRATRDLDLPDIGSTGDLGDASGSEATGVLTRIESAIPSTDAAGSQVAQRDRMPRTRTFLVAAALAVCVVGGSALAITHPWDPTATDTKAKTPADTSQQGFPGVVESLTGQDGSKGATDGEAEGDPVFAALSSAHGSLGELAGRVDACEEALREKGASADEAARAAAQAEAEGVSLEVSNLIAQIQQVDDGAGVYAEDKEHLVTLGNWLRNRCDALARAWERSLAAADPAAEAQAIVAPVDAAASYRDLFEESYEAWTPVEPS